MSNLKSSYYKTKNRLSIFQGFVSLKALVLGYIGLILLQWYYYGYQSFGYEFYDPAKASYWMILGLVWRVKLSKTVFYFLIAAVVDYFFWPYIFREEVQDED
jgi:hypothetical protein